MNDRFETARPERCSANSRPRPGPARRLVLALVATAGVTAVSAAAATSLAAAATGTVDVVNSANFGPVLATDQGLALYTFPNDVNGMSKCTGACAQVWPALTVPAGTTPTAGTGVTGTVAAVLQANGTYQVTYNGSPVYRFVGDTSSGQVTGNGVGGFAVVKVAAPPAPTTTAPAPPPTSAPTAAPTSTPTPTATSAPASTGAPAPASSAAPGSAPAVAAASGAAPSNASTGTAGAAPTTLAATGPGPGLVWTAVVGAGLIAISIALGLLVMEDKTRIGRRAWRGASRSGRWLLGR
jgi:predicted lipoprotein with Yx(FWY)xxD motif